MELSGLNVVLQVAIFFACSIRFTWAKSRLNLATLFSNPKPMAAGSSFALGTLCSVVSDLVYLKFIVC